MIDTENDDRDDAVTGIKGAFDREVARRFDGDRLANDHARAIESDRSSAAVFGAAGDARDRRRLSGATSGPFARVPVPLQWLGLAAALIAAVAGIFSLYRGGRVRAPASVVADGSVASPEVALKDPTSTEGAEGSKPIPDVPPAEHATPTRRAGQAEREQSPAPKRDQDTPLSAPGPDAPSSTGPRSVATIAPDPKGSAPAPASGGGAGPSTPTRIAGDTVARSAPAPDRSASSKNTVVIATGAVPSRVEPVRVEQKSLLSQGIWAKANADERLQATLVMIDGTARFRGRSSSTFRSLAEQNRPQAGGESDPPASEAGPTQAGGSRDPREAKLPDEARPESPGGERVRTAVARGSEGVYYVRAFVGSVFDDLSQEDQGYLAEGVDAIQLRAHEAWGEPTQIATMRRTFRLRSLVAIDGASVTASTSGYGAGELSVAAGGKVYAIRIRGQRLEGASAGYAISAKLARTFPFPTGTAGASAPQYEIPVIVQDGAMAVVCIPDALFSDRGWAGTGPQNMLLVAISPRFEVTPTSKPTSRPSEQWDDPAVVVDRLEPIYPEEARARGIQGKVNLQATVLSDGSVDGVRVTSITQYAPPGNRWARPAGAVLLIEPASSALRRWRFLPARNHGERVDSIVSATIEFRLDRGDEKEN